MLLNLTNHPGSRWSSRQMNAALDTWESVVDYPFPDVLPEAEEKDIIREARVIADDAESLHPDAVLCQGEMSMVFVLSLIAGELVTKEIHQEITYADMYSSIDNIWSVLFTTGYLTQRGRCEGRSFPLAIPNLEVREIFTTQIMDLFKKDAKQDGKALDALCHALQDGNAREAQKQLRKYLKKTISIRDTFARKELKESFYHGMLLGLLAFKGSWAVFSNREDGEGYAYIIVEINDDDVPMRIVIEVKYARDGKLDAACQEALGQIEKRQYGDVFEDEDIVKVLKYGIACYKDKCRIMLSAVNQIADSKD